MAGKPHFELFYDVAHKPRFRLRAPNGEIVCTSEAYESKRALQKGVEAVKRYATNAETQNLLRPTT